ncbi:hypothetical protein PS2_042971 [Malus domestica]
MHIIIFALKIFAIGEIRVLVEPVPVHHARPQATRPAACDGPARFPHQACSLHRSSEPKITAGASAPRPNPKPDTQLVSPPIHHRAARPVAVPSLLRRPADRPRCPMV